MSPRTPGESRAVNHACPKCGRRTTSYVNNIGPCSRCTGTKLTDSLLPFLLPFLFWMAVTAMAVTYVIGHSK